MAEERERLRAALIKRANEEATRGDKMNEHFEREEGRAEAFLEAVALLDHHAYVVMSDAMEGLSYRERRTLEMRSCGDGLGKVAKTFDITVDRVRQIQNQAAVKLVLGMLARPGVDQQAAALATPGDKD